ncbi:integrin alpha-PS5-like isoform X2 [Sitophilus oryzae]|uniref:Integrin alpha-PS5-like isoform X2 n=1 Tax=Sitophilus oryzae TaxID=7048 RepID=A0A6J2YCH5_SITOR|nr:integrin alpha-PS5-like isoform X2 [Sitophilus oryzae]
MCRQLIILVACLFVVDAENSEFFMTKKVTYIKQDAVRNNYFSYSLLLQSGQTGASVIVGAPRSGNSIDGNGDVFKCSWNYNEEPTCYRSGIAFENGVQGNFFGGSLDGEDKLNGSVVICAPRSHVTSKLSSRLDKDYMRGFCIYARSSNFREYVNTNVFRGSSYTGITAVYALNQNPLAVLMPNIKLLNAGDACSYFGYSVATINPMPNSLAIWYLAGEPRGNDLKGKATLFSYNGRSTTNMLIIKNFYGEEVGSYFGASVLGLDVSGDGFVDIFVSAPMSKGQSWNEGAVYFYKGIKKSTDFHKPKQIHGLGGGGSLFGSAISSLGDFDLDGYNDIAISAPYEGNGAVYIYRGSPTDLKFSQRITPSQFNIGDSIKGFGLGLSRGNDIDQNGHNDIAIGAYKTEQVFIIRSRNIIDFDFTLKPSVQSIVINTRSFELTVSILCTKRSEHFDLSQINFNVYMDTIDSRLSTEKEIDTVSIPFRQVTYKNYTFEVKKNKEIVTNISPLEINVTLSVDEENVIANGLRTVLLEIPFLHGCGSDNVCNTGLSLQLKSEKNQLIVGQDTEIVMEVQIINEGDPAYKCELNIEVSSGIELRSSKSCFTNDTVYVCEVSNILNANEIEVNQYIFDIGRMDISIEEVVISVKVTSLGKNKDGFKNNDILKLPVRLVNLPFLISKSKPENTEIFKDNADESEIDFIHEFSVGKTGPSPLAVDLQISLPSPKYQNKDIFEVKDIKGTINMVDFSCTPTITAPSIDVNETDLLTVPLEKSIILSCNDNSNCVHYLCKDAIIENSRDLAVIQIKLSIRSSLLVQAFIQEFNSKDFVAFIPSAIQYHSEGSISASSVFLIFAQKVSHVPFWVYLVAAIIALMLLVILVWTLYKLHFFDRNYKDKLEQEKILQEDEEIAKEIYDHEVFTRFEGNRSQNL